MVPVGRGTDSGLVDDDAPVREVNVPPTPNLDSKRKEILSVRPVKVLGHSSNPFAPVAKRLPLSMPELTRTFPTRSRLTPLLNRFRLEIHYLAMLVPWSLLRSRHS